MNYTLNGKVAWYVNSIAIKLLKSTKTDSIEDSYVPVTQIPPIVISYINNYSVVSNQDIGICVTTTTLEITELFHHDKGTPSCYLFIALPLQVPNA